MEIDINDFAFFVKLVEDRLDKGIRTSNTECIEMYRKLVIKIHSEDLESNYSFFKDCTIKEYKFSQTDYNKIENFMVDSKKINAIKFFREVTGVGLKESKEAIEDTFPEITAAINTNWNYER